MPPKSLKKITTPTVTPEVSNITPIVEAVATQATATTTDNVKQKGGRKQSKPVEATPAAAVEATPAAVEATPAVVEATPAVVEATPAAVVTKSVKKGGAKVTKPVITTSEVSTPLIVKKRAPKCQKVETPVVEGSTPTDEQVGGKTNKKQSVLRTKTPKKVKEVTESTSGETDVVETTTDRLIRSFKVKLPDKEEFEGRFTGLTPYQAANKALSKYFRETENPKQEITFLICESTRKSKKSLYTYVGKRYQLQVPVKYTIQDGREIVKNFKNSLKKVKKVDLIDKSGGALTNVVPATV
jgi:hypothetical protein